MTNEQARSELEQLYMSLSEKKKKALDVAFKAMEQADNIPVMYYPQVDGITPTVVAQADGEKTCVTCRNNDTYHCADCENKSDWEDCNEFYNWDAPIRHKADREYILKKDVMCCIGQTSLHWELASKLRKLPSVAIPPDHDGCKDCRWQSQSETEMPCKQCMHNYTDEWERAKIGHWIWQTEDIYQCSECGEDIHVKEVMNEPQYAWCPICGCPMEIER